MWPCERPLSPRFLGRQGRLRCRFLLARLPLKLGLFKTGRALLVVVVDPWLTLMQAAHGGMLGAVPMLSEPRTLAVIASCTMIVVPEMRHVLLDMRGRIEPVEVVDMMSDAGRSKCVELSSDSRTMLIFCVVLVLCRPAA